MFEGEKYYHFRRINIILIGKWRVIIKSISKFIGFARLCVRGVPLASSRRPVAPANRARFWLSASQGVNSWESCFQASRSGTLSNLLKMAFMNSSGEF